MRTRQVPSAPDPGRRRTLIDTAVVAVVAAAAALGACACGNDPEPRNSIADPAAAASAGLDERALLPIATQDDDRTDVSAEASGSPAVDASNDSGLGHPDGTNGAGLSKPGEVVSPYNLALDDCFDWVQRLVSGRPVTTFTRLPCSEPHMFQVFDRLAYPAPVPSPHPGDDAMEDFALLSCYRRFENWAGSVYETSALEMEVLTPDRDDFEHELYAYRGIHCLVRRVDSEPLSATARSSGL